MVSWIYGYGKLRTNQYCYYRQNCLLFMLSDPITIYEKVSWKSSHQSYLKKFTDFTAINALHRFKTKPFIG
ncbi:hypothetical protein HUG17_7024 [Dermatophagoides farinae]|uniref:Uncharacterized protein n=1 Tax=Dermatophagoides farinae TaxID=6954 RepID=A0A9D4SCR7_DERFA|nr:hypothetical protein HUG17_7024 [Dermatophagoides farinae]